MQWKRVETSVKLYETLSRNFLESTEEVHIYPHVTVQIGFTAMQFSLILQDLFFWVKFIR